MHIFEKKIKQLQIRQNLIIAFRFFLMALNILILLFNLYFVVYLKTSNNVRELFLFATTIKISLIMIFIYLVLKANRSMKTKLQIAKQMDESNLDKTDTYQNAFELQFEDVKPVILERILAKADSKAEKQKLRSNKSFLSLIWKISIIICLAAGLLFGLHFNKFNSSLKVFSSRKMPKIAHKDFIQVLPGDISITRNKEITIEVVDPEPDVEHSIFYKLEKKWREEKLVKYKKVFRNLDYSFNYFVKTPYAVSDTFRVTIFELPIVDKIHISYDYPQYTGLKSQIEKDATGNIKAVKGTEVRMEIEANNPIEKAQIYFSNSKLSDMQRLGRSSFTTKFETLENLTYHFGLVDILGNRSKRIKRSIDVVNDEHPMIKILHPGRDTLLTQNMLLPLKVLASDDFGLQDLQLNYSVNYEEEKNQLIEKEFFSTTVTHEHIFDLTKEVLIPGDKITYWFQISDNSPDKKVAYSSKYVARFPSIEEIYKEIEKEEKQKSKDLNNTLQKSQELQKEFENKRRELMKKEEINWEDKKQIQKLLKDQEDLSKDVEKAADDFQKMIKKFEDNQAISSETLEKMKKIQDLMEEISNEELMKAMENLQKKMEDIDPEVMKKAMEKFDFSMEDFSKKLEQTIKLLEDIKKEQSMQKALEIAEEMEKMQNDINQKTSENALSKEKLSKQQKKISEKLKNLEEQLEKTREMLDSKKDSELMEEMKKLREQMKKDSLASDLDNSEQSLKQGKMQKAQESQQSASKKMQQIKMQLQKMQQMMSSGMMMDAAEIIEKTVRRLLIYSQYHEDAFNKYTNDPFIILKDEIAVFEGIDLTLKELYQTPMITLMVGPKFIYDTNYTITKFKELFQYINEANISRTDNYLLDIRKGLNLMIFDLMQAQNNMQQGGGGGMQSMMQTLKQMGQQQMMMNMLTQKLMQQLSENGRMSSQMRRDANKLARDQQRIADNLKRMLQTNREAQKQTAAINKMIEDIESVAHDLKRGRLDKKLIQTQERILSRLLDAQKSIHKREFSKKRKSEISDVENWDLPDEIKIKFDKMRKKALLKEDYKDFPREYQELIKEYLRILNEKYDSE